MSLNAFCQPKRERGGGRERENGYERKGRGAQYSVKQREGKGDEREQRNTEREGGENVIGKEAERKNKRLHKSARRRKQTFFLNKKIKLQTQRKINRCCLSFPLESLGCHGNKAMDTLMERSAKKS